MIKTIEFRFRGKFVNKDVDLDRLDGVAKLLVLLILTTDSRDDASYVSTINKITLHEQLLKDGVSLVKCLEMGEFEDLDSHQILCWKWDDLQPNEVNNPEMYFIRHAKKMEAIGAVVNTGFAYKYFNPTAELQELIGTYGWKLKKEA